MEGFDSSQDPAVLDELKTRLGEREKRLFSPAAAVSESGVRRHPVNDRAAGYRQAFSLDGDRILHSRAYARYIDKTQVFYLIENDHITHRVLHVQLVSKIARTIGRFLRLNEDLIEAIALGHDIGHTPFGHEGETYLSDLCEKAGIGPFLHNVQSIQFLDRVERKGLGWNLCLQTLDGILCHDGEIHNQRLAPQPGKNFATFDKEIESKKSDPSTSLIPMTTEGCVVRMADTIAYIGRDLEDAIRLGILNRRDLPGPIVKILGNTNGTIVYRLVTDIIENSADSRFVAFSPMISDALKALKRFNLERIYLNPKIKVHSLTIEKLFAMMFEKKLEELETNDRSSDIFTRFLADMSEAYRSVHSPPEIVRDYIAGMTDRFFLSRFPKELRPSLQG
jgi:dGTPase